MPYYGDGAPYYYGGSYANHSSITSSVGRYYSPIAARYSPHLSTISESPSYVVRRRHGPTSSSASSGVPFARPRRIIDTADIDVTKPPRRYGQDSSQQQQQQRHRLRRDRPTIKIRSQALKDNPALREYNEKHEKTVGELLVEKFLIKDKQEQQSRQQAAEQRRMRLYHQASLLRPESSPPISKDEDEDLLAAMRRRVTRRMTRRRSSADVIPLNPEQIEREAALLAAQAEALDTLVAEEQAEIEVEVRRGTFAKRQAMRLPSEISELSETEQEDEDPRSSSHRHAAKKKRRKRSEQLVVSSADSDEEEDDDEIVLEIPESVIEEEEEEFEWDDRHKCDDLRDIVPSNGEVIIKVNDVIAAKSKERMAADTEGLTSQPRKTHESNGFGEADVKLAVNDITSDVKVEPPKRKISLEIIDAKIQETQRELKDLICKEKRFPELKRREKMLKLDETDKKEVKAATGSTVPLTGGRGKADNSETVEPLVDKSAAVKEAKDASKVVAATRDDVVTKDEATTKREKNEIATKVKKDETTMKIDKDETTTNDKNEATRKLGKDELATREKNDEAARKEKKSESTAKEKKSESPAKVKKDEKKTSKAKEKTKSSEGDGKLKPKADRSLKRTKSAPQADLGTEKELVPRFKIEACNSVGDFSTLYVKAAAASPEAVPVRTIEQFRESIRLPAPRIDVELPLSKSNSSVDAAVVLPARKPYVLDTTRNSVYLALRQPPSPGGDGRPVGAPSAQDQSIVAPSADTRKESTERTIASPRPANCVENRSIIESPEAVISAKQRAELISDAGAKPSDKSQIGEKSARVKAPAREEFVAWWDETPEHKATPAQGKKAVEKKPEDKVAPAQENKAVEKKPEDKVAPAQEKKVIEKKLEDKVDKSKKNAESVKPEDDRLKAKGQTATDEKTGASKTEKAVVDLVDVKVKTGLGETKEKTADKKDKAIDESKEIKQTVEKSKSPDIKKKPADVKPSDKPVTPGKEVAASVAQEIKSTVDETKPKASAAHKPAEAKEPKPSKTDVPVIESKEKPDKSPDKKEKAAKVSSKPQPPSKPVAAAANEQEEKKAQQPRPKLSSEKERAGEAASPEGAPSRAPSRDKSALSGRPEKKQPRSESPRLERQPLANIPEEPAVSPPADSGPISLVKRDERKRRVDAAAVMKIEKRILEESDSPHGIRSGAMPESQIIELARKREEAEAAAAAAAAAQNADAEIDFWSEIKAPRQSVKLPVAQEARKHSLRLDLDRISAPGAGEEEPATPLAPDQLDETTPLISEPATPLRENLAEVPLTNLKLSGMLPRDEEDEELERTGTVKKMSKWSNRDNLSNLNDVDGEVTPVASKEVSPQVSLSSTTKKKKIVKKKKSVTAGSKKKGSEKAESKPGTAKGSKLLGGKRQPGATAAASPQTSLLRAPLSAAGSPRNSPSQRPADLNKLFYTTPAILLTATPRDLRKVRRAKVKRKKPPTRTPSLSSDSTGSTRSTATNSTEEGSNCEEDAEHKRLASTRSNDSGFDGSPRLSNCDMVCHKKCEKLTGNLCGLNQKLVAEALQALKKAPSQSSENQRNAESEHFHHSGRITPPATNLPRFKKYEVTDFNFLKVLGKGSFGKVLLAELRGTECVYAVKCLKKDVVLEDDDVECTLIERKVLTLATRHPYLCHLFCTFQTESHLFFVMEYLNGGDLMFHIQKSGRFSETRARFYAAEIWSGLIFLHKKGIVYRDLKLDNVLLDFEGHIRIADFGMCKLQIFLDRTADTFCGTPDYMAPEIIKGLKYNQAVDWWSYGVLLYEMLTGQSPFSGCDEDELFWSICNERPFIPRYLGQSSTELLVCLLEKDAGKRIPGHEIACHSFFSTIAWDKLERRTLEPPFKPAVEHTLDTRYFDTAFTTERPRLTPVPNQILTSMDQSVFRGFSYTNPNATD